MPMIGLSRSLLRGVHGMCGKLRNGPHGHSTGRTLCPHQVDRCSGRINHQPFGFSRAFVASSPSFTSISHHTATMSSLSFYEISLTPIIIGLKNTHAFLKKAEEHAKANKTDVNDFVTARLYPDMANFAFQIQRLTDAAKFIPTRINPAIEGVSIPDTEKTFAELVERVQKTISYLEGIDPKSFEGREQAEIQLSIGGKFNPKFTGASYVFQFGHPNFWFHVTTAYDILRAQGVDVGKMDFLNGAKLIQV
ncbi:hypothetical protein NX059_001301 [Plenodomus lindquistii]|nr:hypothetical protein NX059_001301 [Plenodomus lindquistii]